MISHADLASFQKLRKRIFSLIEKALEEYGGGKPYEGNMSIEFPGYFDEEPRIKIVLYCYVLGIGRHHEWYGRTMKDALDMAWKDIERWEDQNYDNTVRD